MIICHNYQDTLGFLAYMELYAPDFPDEDEMTMEIAISNVRHGLKVVESQTTNSGSLEKLISCQREFNQAVALYEVGNVLEAEKHIHSAYEWFRKLRA